MRGKGGIMEHRCGERLSMNLPAIVHTTGGEAVRVTIRNMSCGGAYIAMSASRVILRGLVELELRLPYAECRLYRWRAFVVHRKAEGVGLMFNDLQLGDLLPYLAAEKTSRRITPSDPVRPDAVDPALRVERHPDCAGTPAER